MGGGREIPILISTAAIVGIGTTIAKTKRIVPKSNVFIFLPPFDNNSLIFPSRNGRHHGTGDAATRGAPIDPEVKSNHKIIEATFFIYFPLLKYFTRF
jgi:hypothetical protein